MKKFVVTLTAGMVALVAWMGVHSGTASAIPPFKKEWDAVYAKDGTPLAKAASEAKCNVCHKANALSKKERNPYGEALAKILKKTEKDPEKIREAIKKIEAEKAGAATFGELISAGKLPADG